MGRLAGVVGGNGLNGLIAQDVIKNAMLGPIKKVRHYHRLGIL